MWGGGRMTVTECQCLGSGNPSPGRISISAKLRDFWNRPVLRFGEWERLAMLWLSICIYLSYKHMIRTIRMESWLDKAILDQTITCFLASWFISMEWAIPTFNSLRGGTSAALRKVAVSSCLVRMPQIFRICAAVKWGRRVERRHDYGAPRFTGYDEYLKHMPCFSRILYTVTL